MNTRRQKDDLMTPHELTRVQVEVESKLVAIAPLCQLGISFKMYRGHQCYYGTHGGPDKLVTLCSGARYMAK